MPFFVSLGKSRCLNKHNLFWDLLLVWKRLFLYGLISSLSLSQGNSRGGEEHFESTYCCQNSTIRFNCLKKITCHLDFIFFPLLLCILQGHFLLVAYWETKEKKMLRNPKYQKQETERCLKLESSDLDINFLQTEEEGIPRVNSPKYIPLS